MKFYVVNQRMKRDGTGALVPAFSLENLERVTHGHEIVMLYDSSEPSRSVGDMILTLRERLANFERGDALVLCGDPLLMFLSAIFADQSTGGDYLLYVWRKEAVSYVEVDMASVLSDAPQFRYITQ